MRGLELVMWPQGQLEASKKIAPDGTDNQTNMATVWLSQPIQWKNIHLFFLWVKQIFVTVLKVVTKAQKKQKTKIRFDKNILNKNYETDKVIEIEIQCLPYCFNIAY